MKLLVTIGYLLLAASLAGASVCVKQHSIPVIDPNPGHAKGPIFRECRYLIDEEVIEALPVFDPQSGEGLFPAHSAMSVAYDAYFAVQGISKEEFFRMASVTLEKIDDYTMSSLSDEIRMRKGAIRKLWFYVITCDWPRMKEMKEAPAPAIVLMNGRLVVAAERRKRLLER